MDSKILKLNASQRALLYENLKDVLNQKFKELGDKTMLEMYGATTQTIIREAIYTHCFNKPITTEIEKGDYVFTFTLIMPVFGDKFDLIRKINKKRLDGMG